MSVIRPVIRPMLLPIGPTPEGPLFAAINSFSQNTFSESGETFTAITWQEDGSFVLTQTLEVFWELIAGGGPGGNATNNTNHGGGGGAGGYRLGSATLSAGTYLVRVGLGGLSSDTNGVPGSNGTNSRILLENETLITDAEALGGGAGGGNASGSSNQVGAAGGSGGGGAGISQNRSGGAGTSGQGNAGGGGVSGGGSSERASGGGGGAGAVGGDATANVFGAGGAGIVTLFNGISATVCVGGNGCSQTVVTTSINTGFGNGGHGRRDSVGDSMNGQNGRVVVRYKL